MARTPKAPKNSSLPESIELRKTLDEYLTEVVGYMQEIDKQDMYIKEVKDVLTDSEGKFNLEGKYLGLLIKARYDQEKAKQEATARQAVLDDLDVLAGE